MEDKILPIEILGRTRAWRDSREAREIPSDPQSLSQAKDGEDEWPAHIAEQLSGRVDRAKLDPWQMEDLSDIGSVVGQEDATELLWALRRPKGAKYTES